MKHEIGIIGLGKMGSNLAKQLLDKDWKVVGYNRSPEKTESLIQIDGFTPAYSIEELVSLLSPPRVLWLMISAGSAIDQTLEGESGLVTLLERDDVIIDGGNSYFKETLRRAEIINSTGIQFLDAGVSGGPDGARNGACIMIGGDQAVFDSNQDLFETVSVPNGYSFFPGHGAGHFVKMVHNAIEYGMMQSIAEGFDIMKQIPDFNLDMQAITDVYNHGSVIESRLIGWMQKAFEVYGDDLEGISGKPGQGGTGAGATNNKSEAEWTVDVAKEMHIPTTVIEDALKARELNRENPTFQGKIINALRNQFGGHKADEA